MTKLPLAPDAHRRSTVTFQRARDGLRALLSVLDWRREEKVLLPAYVGWSPKEGSGVFDPVRQAGVNHDFYRVTRNLDIDLEDFERSLRGGGVRVVVLTHFFGYPPPSAAPAASLARKAGALVVEDEAHSLYSDWVGGVCGRWGDVVLYAFHKMLPVASGGALAFNPGADRSLVARLEDWPGAKALSFDLASFDHLTIAAVRRKNAEGLLELLAPLKGRVDPLHSALPAGVVPQTLPVLVSGFDRDRLYEQMNSYGFGAVSLYHTLVKEIEPSQYPDSHWLSARILNLPIHQDVPDGGLEAMVEQLERIVEEAP